MHFWDVHLILTTTAITAEYAIIIIVSLERIYSSTSTYACWCYINYLIFSIFTILVEKSGKSERARRELYIFFRSILYICIHASSRILTRLLIFSCIKFHFLFINEWCCRHLWNIKSHNISSISLWRRQKKKLLLT